MIHSMITSAECALEQRYPNTFSRSLSALIVAVEAMAVAVGGEDRTTWRWRAL